MKCIVCGEKVIATVVFIPVCKTHHEKYLSEIELPIRERHFFWQLVDLDYQKSLKNLCKQLEADDGNI